MIFHGSAGARGRGRTFFRAFGAMTLAALFCFAASAQTSSSCTQAQSVPSQVTSTGLAEQIGDLVLQCTGGSSGNTVIANLYITLNTNITNSLDSNGNPQNITITSSGPAAVTENSPILTSANTLEVANITYTVPTPNTIPMTITISGIRAAVNLVSSGQSGTLVTANLIGIGVSLPNLTFPIAIGFPALAASVQNNGVPCTLVPLPSSTDFNSFINAGIASSAMRITEMTATAFAPQVAGETSGTRIIVQLSGYGVGAQLWVPNALVGNSGSVPTSAGQFNSTIGSGVYTPNAHQLLLSLVTGADQNGNGGTLVTALPAGGTTFTALTQLNVSNGSAYAVYEVLDDSPFVAESVQVPVFILSSLSNCSLPLVPQLSAMEGPISTVSVATATDPIPRFISAALGPDCQLAGDCNQTYFPVLSLSTAPVSLTGNAQGLTQSASVALLNNGGSILTYTSSVSYQSGSGWLSVTPSTADVQSGLSLSIIADPTNLQQGTYTATVTVNGGEAGSASIPVTFTVGPPGATIRAIVNAASYQTGVTPGSYAALYGSLLAGTNVGVTFNGMPADKVVIVPAPYNQTQINLIVPASLAPQSGVSVVATVDGKVSNTFPLTVSTTAPGVFNPGILNADSSVNTASNPAARGSFVQVYLTGLTIPVVGTLTVTMGGQTGIVPLPGQTYGTVLEGLDQVNVVIPSTLTAGATSVSVCVAALPGVPPLCSNSVNLYVK